jgi:hypothetical protein
MNRDETNELLRLRWSLTSQSLNDQVVDVWHQALAHYAFVDLKAALLRVALDHKQITVAHLTEQLPRPRPPEPDKPTEPEGELISLSEYLARLDARGTIDGDHPANWTKARARLRLEDTIGEPF